MNKYQGFKKNKYPLWLRFTDGGAGGGDAGTGGGKPPEPGDTGDNADGGGKKPDSSVKAPFAIFPDQASFDARLARAGRAEVETLAKELGFENADAMKEAAKKAREQEESQKTEAEKERQRAEKAEAEAKAAKADKDTALITAEIKLCALQAGFVDPADAVALVKRDDIKVEDSGTVLGVKEAVEALGKEKPHLLGKAKKQQIGSSGNPGGDDDGSGLSEEERGRKLAEERRKQRQQPSGGWDPWAKS